MTDRRKIKFGLRSKITILIFALVAVFSGVITLFSSSLNVKMQEKEIKKSILQITNTLGALRLVTQYSTKDEKNINWASYEKFMDLITENDKNILFMAVLDNDGTVKAKAMNIDVIKKDFKKIDASKSEAELSKYLLTTKINDTLKAVQKISIKGEAVASLVIKFSIKSYERDKRNTIIQILLLSLLMMTAGFAGAWALAYVITKQFGIIATGMSKLAQGDVGASVDLRSNDEIGQLADDFNSMVYELKKKVRIEGAFDSVAKELEELRIAYKTFAFQSITDRITKDYYPQSKNTAGGNVLLFIDIAEIANFTYEMISDELKEILKNYIEKISSSVIQYQGALLKVTEKFVLVGFGYPFNHEDDMRRAVISAVSLRKDLIKLIKDKVSLGYNVENFNTSFIIIKGQFAGDLIDSATMTKYRVIADYLNFASKYGEQKQFSADIYVAGEITAETQTVARYDKVDTVTANDGSTVDIFKLSGTKF